MPCAVDQVVWYEHYELLAEIALVILRLYAMKSLENGLHSGFRVAKGLGKLLAVLVLRTSFDIACSKAVR